MPKRKRNHEPSLEEKLSQWHKELARGMKTAKGFERQRLSKRIREAQSDPEKTARFEREIAVLKSLDLQQAAHAHLCSSLLKVKGVAESPKIPADIIKPIPKPEGLSDEEKAALHNVTSALCNRKQIRDVIEEAIMGTCIALRVPMPEKLKKGKGKKEKKDSNKEEQDGGRDTTRSAAIKNTHKEKDDEDEDEEKSDTEENGPGLVLLKRKQDKAEDDKEELGSEDDDEAEDDQPFENFSDSDAEERAWSRYDDFVAGSSSDEDESGDDGSGDDELVADSRTKSLRKATADDISISSVGSSESDQEEEEEDLEDAESQISASASPPPKRAKAAKTAAIIPGNSAFLPSLMGGYISGSESEASDLDLAPARKNRRGQRARQAIWEKKYKEKAKHVQKQQEGKTGRDQGWDMRRGAVGDEEGSNKPWKKGIRNPFDNKHIHPERQQQLHGGREQASGRSFVEDNPKPKAIPKRDDTGLLHPSWAAAKKAKEEGQKIAFQGRKVVFD
ncbi:putative nadh-ubiquinone oxidoreductase kda subunit protein [Daldinia childiae]|uniref:putative nadh-ubiquinone oxidoreductase kda subunit protein n=1 Tax=Daldinia childiae TaxID=326645 RepID=UPI001447FCD2|nr:putative nadh-ubiquinone oxidoreductase kda subunit protein [Daldinia childiae]KAF3062358.1 putative nadh-ubiquinone oxidoreductase kda subunit protein [Daldinia childiae]